jgi:hypothetical protein
VGWFQSQPGIILKFGSSSQRSHRLAIEEELLEREKERKAKGIIVG